MSSPKNGFLAIIILKPLWVGGLWEPVTIKPPSALVATVAKYSIGVGPRPIRSTFTPVDRRPLTTAASISGELTRPS